MAFTVFVLFFFLLVLSVLVASLHGASSNRRRSKKATTEKKKSPTLATTKISTSSSIDRDVNDPFENFAKYLVLSSSGKDKNLELNKYDSDRIRRAVKKLAKSQDTLKTVDGAAHQFRSTFSGSSTSLTARFDKFMSGSQKKMKEAGKLYEYVNTVERSLQAAEILQAIACNDEKQRELWLKDAGLCELKRTVLSCNGVHCVISVMTPLAIDTSTGNVPKHEQIEDTTTFKTDTSPASATSATGRSTTGPIPSVSSSSVGMSKQQKKKTLDMSRRFEPGELVVGIVDECSGVIVPPSDVTIENASDATTKKPLKQLKSTKKRKHDNNEEEHDDEGEEILTSVDERKSRRNRVKRSSKVNPAQRSVSPTFDPNRVASPHINALVHLLWVLTEPEQSLSLHSVGLVKEEISVQPTLMKLAVDALKAMSEYILPADERSESIENRPKVVSTTVVLAENENTTKTIDLSPSLRPHIDENSDIIRVAKSTKITSVGSTSDGITKTTTTTTTTAAAVITNGMVVPTNNHNTSPTINIIHANINTSNETIVKKSKNGRLLPDKIRIVGHSAGGAVAAYASMVLEGFLNCTTSSLTNETAPFVGIYGSNSASICAGSGSSIGDGSALRNKNKSGRRSSDGSGQGRVECLCLGPPPCVSRTVVPRFISSILCGDDIIPRATRDTLLGARDRVIKALQAGAGEKLAIGWMMGSGWMSDLQSVTGRGLGNYAGGGHDLSALSVPGRAFYMKSRQFKQGASMQRVLRGQWREDLLWMLHEILLSSKMLEHHSLDAYIRTLARC